MNKQNKQIPQQKSSVYGMKNSERPSRVITKGNETPPLTHGPKRLHYQYSTVLPTTHLTLVSILQGIAFGVLLEGIPLPDLTHAPSLVFFTNQYFYLPYLVSSILIILIWKEFVEACIFINWPISTFQTGLIYLIALFEILAFKIISSTEAAAKMITSGMFSGWLICLGCVGIVGGIIRLNNSFLEEARDYESQELAKSFFKTERAEGFFYIGSGVTVFIIDFVYNIVLKMAPFIPWIAIIILFIVLIIVLIVNIRNRSDVLKKYIGNSDLELSKRGMLRYKVLEQEDILKQENISTYDPSYEYVPSSRLWLARK